MLRLGHSPHFHSLRSLGTETNLFPHNRGWNPSLMCARQVLYHWATPSSSYFSFWDRAYISQSGLELSQHALNL